MPVCRSNRSFITESGFVRPLLFQLLVPFLVDENHFHPSLHDRSNRSWEHLLIFLYVLALRTFTLTLCFCFVNVAEIRFAAPVIDWMRHCLQFIRLLFSL